MVQPLAPSLQKLRENDFQFPLELLQAILIYADKSSSRLLCKYTYYHLPAKCKITGDLTEIALNILNIKSCTHLDITNSTVAQIQFEQWVLPQNLKILNLSWNNIDDNLLPRISLPHGLIKLFLHNNVITGSCFKHWSIPATLKVLKLTGNLIHSEQLSKLKLPKEIETFELWTTKFTFLDISSYQHMKSFTIKVQKEETDPCSFDIRLPPHLESLTLWESKLREINFLIPDSVTYLNLFSNKLTGDGLKKIQWPKKLQELNLNHNVECHSLPTFELAELAQVQFPKTLKTIHVKDCFIQTVDVKALFPGIELRV